MARIATRWLAFAGVFTFSVCLPASWVRAGNVTWSPKTPCNFGRGPVGASAVTLTGLYAMGVGGDSFNNFFYSPAFDSWETRTGPTTGIGIAEGGAAGILLKVYVVSGWGYGFYTETPIQIYDEASDSWATGPNLPVLRYRSVAKLDGKIYIFGGGDGNLRAVKDVYLYDPAGGPPTQPTSLPIATCNAAVAVFGDRIYLFGGRDANDPDLYLDAVQVYHPASNSWASGPPIPYPAREAASAAAINGKIYLIGGAWAYGQLKDVLEYIPTSDATKDIWHTDRLPLQTERQNFAAGVSGVKIYVALGRNDTLGYLASTEQGTPVKLFVVMIRGYNFKIGDDGCGSDGLDEIQTRIANNSVLGPITQAPIFCSYYDEPIDPNREPIDYALGAVPDGTNEKLILLGHSHGGFYAYWLAKHTDKYMPGIPINGLITIDPVDWRTCYDWRNYGDPRCLQDQEVADAPPGVPFIDYMQTSDGKIRGYNIGCRWDQCNGTEDERTRLSNKTFRVPARYIPWCYPPLNPPHVCIDNSNRVQTAIIKILKGLI